MSAIMLGLAFKANTGNVNRKAVLLKLADHAHDDGTNIYPSVARIADETHLSTRTVQRVLGEFVKVELLHLVEHETGGRGKSRNYMLNVPMLQALALGEKGDTQSLFTKGATQSPIPAKRVTDQHERVTDKTTKGDTACHPNHQEPSGNISDRFSDFWSAYPRTENRRQAEVEFNHAVAGDADPETIIAGAKAYAVKVAAQGREPKFIKLPAGWLSDRMWQDEDTSGFVRNHRFRMITKADPEWQVLLEERRAAGAGTSFMEKYGSFQVPLEYAPGAGAFHTDDGGKGFHWRPHAEAAE